MNYTTRFNLGDHVWGVSTSDFKRIVRCKPCGNTGKISICDELLICPKCNGRSTHTEYVGNKFYVSTFDAVVGKVSVEHVDSLYARWDSGSSTTPKATYMVSNTGVGSGQVWSEERLFLSEAEAQAYCDQHNGTLPTDETESGRDIVGLYGEVIGGAA